MSETFLGTEVPHQYIAIANRKHIYDNLSEHIRRVLIELYNIKNHKEKQKGIPKIKMEKQCLILYNKWMSFIGLQHTVNEALKNTGWSFYESLAKPEMKTISWLH